jgi:hypothetical protein
MRNCGGPAVTRITVGHGQAVFGGGLRLHAPVDRMPVRGCRTGAAKNRYRYYRLDVLLDRFGEWCVIRARGRIGRADQIRLVRFHAQQRRRPRLSGSARPRLFATGWCLSSHRLTEQPNPSREYAGGGGYQGRYAPLRGGPRPSPAAATRVQGLSGRDGKTALSRTGKHWMEVKRTRCCPGQTATMSCNFRPACSSCSTSS